MNPDTKRIETLASANKRLMAEKAEALAERDRARATAVELEQQLAAVEADLYRLRDRYQEMWNRNPTEATGWASDAVDDCVDSVELITDVLLRDRAEDAMDGVS